MINADIPTLKDFSIDYLEYKKNVNLKRSWQKDESHLKRFNNYFGNLKLSEITAKHIDDYKQIRVREVKPVTVNHELEVPQYSTQSCNPHRSTQQPCLS